GQLVLLAASNCLMSEKAAARTGDYHSLLLLFDNQVLADFFSRHAAWLDQPTARVASQPFLLVEPDEFLRHFRRAADARGCDDPPRRGRQRGGAGLFVPHELVHVQAPLCPALRQQPQPLAAGAAHGKGRPPAAAGRLPGKRAGRGAGLRKPIELHS
nr:hypothetical protein [Tanacetum cinerariifolium]